MHHESNDTRLARIEEGLVSLHGKYDERHKAVMRHLEPLVEQVKRHQIAIELIKRDKRWLYGIVVFFGGAVSVLIRVVIHS